MNKPYDFLRSGTTLLVIGLMLFLSCASPSQRQEADDGTDDSSIEQSADTSSDQKQEQSEENAKEEKQPEDASAEDSKSATPDETAANELTDLSKESETASSQTANTESDKKVDEALALSDEKTAEQTAGEKTAPPAGSKDAVKEVDDANSEADALLGKNETKAEGTASAKPDTTANSAVMAEGPPVADSGKDADDTGAAVAAVPDDNQASTEDIKPADESSHDVVAPSSPKVSHHAKVAHGGNRNRAPKVPAEAINRKGSTLNRFYFVRKGDNPKNVSQLVYGSPDQAALLQKWNGKHWAPGKVIYFVSPKQADDREMRSFYQERGIQPEEYQVKSGDWLSKIANQKLGSSKSWTEIAVVNGLDRPDQLEKGQKLAIYPADLSSAGQPEEPPAAVTQNEPPQPKAAEIPIPPPAAAQAQPQAAQPAPVQNPAPIASDGSPSVGQPQAANPAAGVGGQPDSSLPPGVSAANPIEQVPPPPRHSRRNQGPDYAKVLEQVFTPFTIGVGGIIMALMLALMMVNKRRRAPGATDEFGDDFSSSPKAKRK